MAFLNFWSSPYELVPIVLSSGPLKKESRYGTLLKFEFSEEGFGYADLHPWLEYGDVSLEGHLSSLTKSSPTQLAKIAMENAYVDAQARKKQKSLLGQVAGVQNNALLVDLTISDLLAQVKAFENQGYTHLKVKMGRDLRQEIPCLKQLLGSSLLKIRLDANAQLSFQQASDFLKLLTIDEKSKVEYFEDPCPFNKADWLQLQKHVPIALDWEATNALALGLPTAWNVLIIKPARQDLHFWMNVAKKAGSLVTITSSMDHPLGVMNALIKAAEVKQKYPDRALISGCQTSQLYQENPFSLWLKNKGPQIVPAQSGDLGMGFTELLKAIPWS